MKGGHPHRTPSPLSPAVEALLVHERVPPPPQPEMVRERAFARARAAPDEFAPAASSPRAAPMRVRRLIFASAAGITLVAGAAAAFQMMRRPAPIPSTETGSRENRTPMMVAPPAETELAPTNTKPVEAPSTGPVRPSSPSRRALPADKHDGGLGEIQLLSRARESDMRGDYADVLGILAEHERRFPGGRLSEDREVLRVKALVGLGRGGEARRAAAKFRRQFPRSILMKKVDEILASPP